VLCHIVMLRVHITVSLFSTWSQKLQPEREDSS
jgi:hypothetical protein